MHRPVVTRRWKYAAPPWRVSEALEGERHAWLTLADGERIPDLVAATPHERVVLAPWVDPEVDDVEVTIASDGGQGTLLTVVAQPASDLSDERRTAVRHRLGVLFGEALRHHVDGW